jgi:Uncharacterized protein conserved in bacteria (DUF2066)
MAHFGAARGVGLFLLSWFLAALAASPAPAQDQTGVFTVSGIEVDVTAADAVTARREALEAGQRSGLERLMRRLTPAETYDRLPSVRDLPIEQYVQSFAIGDEEVSSTQYIAELTVAYDPERVRGLLQERGLPMAQTVSAPLVVLPLYEAPQGATLWPDDNPWWQAWSENLDPERLLRLVLPLGDLEDMTKVSVAQARAGDVDALLNLASRYGSEDILVMIASVQQEGNAAEVPIVRLEARRVGGVERMNEPWTMRGEAGESLQDLLDDAVLQIQDSLDAQWKSEHFLRFDQARLMVVDIPITGLSDWVSINRDLKSLPEVSEVEIAAFSQRNVRAEIRYIGDELRFEEAVLRLGLTLSREGEAWLLQPTGVNPSAGGLPNVRPAQSSPGPL